MILVSSIGLLALALRFFRLTDRSLWLDEIITAHAAHLGGPADVIAFARSWIDQMPLYYMVTWLLHPWGDGAFVLRLQSAVAGTLAVIAVFWVGKGLFGLRAGAIAALLMAVMPYAVWYSQEARDYALLMLLSTLQMYLAYLAIKRGRWFHWLGLGVCTTLNLYTHYLALETTAAVVLFIGGYLLTDLLRNLANRLKVAVSVLLLTAAVAAIFVHWRPVLRSIYLAVFSLADFAKNHRAATLATALVLIAAMAVVVRWQNRRIDAALQRPTIQRLALAIGTGLAVMAAYVPWLPALRVFLASPQGLTRLQLGLGPNLAGLADIPARLGLSWIILAVFSAGLIALGARFWSRRTPETAIVCSWLLVPLVLMFVSFRWAIVNVDIRYFSFVFPAAMLVVGVGADAIGVESAKLVRRLSRRSGRPSTTTLATLFVGALLLAQAVPALATSYQAPKDDWRGVAEHIAGASSPGSVVMSIGAYSDWGVLCLQYYFRQLHSAVTVIDGMQVTSDTIDELGRTPGPTWAVINHASRSQLAAISNSTNMKAEYVDATGDIIVVRATDTAVSAFDQARELLAWEQPLEPQLVASTGLFDLLAGQAKLGPNLVDESASSEWLLSSGASLNGANVVLNPNASVSEVNAFITGAHPAPGTVLRVSFEHETQDLRGSLTVFASAYGRPSQVIASFPSGSGYACGRSDGWVQSYFGLVVPPATTSLVLLLRADGAGTASFRSLAINAISAAA